MRRSLCTCIVVVLTLVGRSRGVMNTSVCQMMRDDTANAAKRPTMPDVFRVSVECKIPEKNQTTYVTEYYDMKGNRGRLTVVDPFNTAYIYYDYNNNDIMVVDPDTSGCLVTPLALDPNRFVFGYKPTPESGSQIYSPVGALHFGNANETYNGTAVIRGIAVDLWVSCQYLSAIDATAVVTWYFASKVAWDSQLGFKTVPVRMVAQGTYTPPGGGPPKSFNHIYDFFDFQDSVDASDFQVPAGVFCPGRITQNVVFPAIPNYFSFHGEIADPYQDIFSVIEENYDNLTGMAEYNFKTDTTHLTGMNQNSELNDYNTGVSYVLDHSTQMCNTLPITGGSVAFVKTVDGNKVRMQTPREFLNDANMNYQYAGQADCRLMTCDRWVGTTSSAPGFVGTNVTVEWYFATSDYHSWNAAVDMNGNVYRIPVLYQLFVPGAIMSECLNYHMFYFNTEEPPLYDVDVSSCFVGAKRKSFRFTLPATSENIVRTNMPATIQSIREAISLFTGISKLRVADIELYFGDTIQVAFDLLDKPPAFSDTVNRNTENNLTDAVSLLRNSFNSKMFSISFAAGDNAQTVTPDYTAGLEDITQLVHMSQSTPDSGGFSAGDLAGLGVAFLVIGGAGGAVGAFFFFK